MLIADAQVHIWAAETPDRPWFAGHPPPHRPVPFSKDDLLREMNEAGVHRAAIVPPSWEGSRNDLGLEAARLHPDRFVVMGQLDTDAPDAREQLAALHREPAIYGLRCSFGLAHQQAPLLEGRVEWLWPELETYRLPIMINVPIAGMHVVERAAERYPGLKLIIDHLAIPKGTKDDAAFANVDKLLALAKHPNVAVKASGLPAHATDGYPYRGLHPHLRRVYDAFGPQRIFWGSDRTKLPCTYRQAVTMFTEEIPWLTAEDKEWIMGRGLCEWIGWEVPQQ